MTPHENANNGKNANDETPTGENANDQDVSDKKEGPARAEAVAAGAEEPGVAGSGGGDAGRGAEPAASEPAPAPYDDYAERPVRVGTVVWGFLLVGIAAVFFTASQVDLSGVSPALIAVWVVLGIGAITITGGVTGALLRRR
ncbi:MAG TPA: hypothetical protein VFQ96_01690 [Microbacteriaceae bacterium]|nr:hypothetical protein [Microbacteriaceae bacterium]